MRQSIIAVIESEMSKSASTTGSFLNNLSPMLLGGAGGGLLGLGAGAFMTKRRKGADGEKEDGSEYRKRMLRNAMMLGGLGAVGGVGGGLALDSFGKYSGGRPGSDGQIPEQGSDLGNLMEHALASSPAAVATGTLGNITAKKIWKPSANAKEYLGSQDGLAKAVKGMGLTGIGEDGKVTNPKAFEASFRGMWDKDENFRKLVDSSLSPAEKATFYKNVGLTDPNASVLRSMQSGLSKATMGRIPAPTGAGPMNKADQILTGLQRGNTSRFLFGRGKGRGAVAAATGISALAPAILGTYVDDFNK